MDTSNATHCKIPLNGSLLVASLIKRWHNTPMNTQLEQIYRQAFGHGPSPIGEPELERFAQLIVKECSSLCRWDQDAWTILEHFGVEP
jgi:hypothetical protein